jgi:hypothetical protein
MGFDRHQVTPLQLRLRKNPGKNQKKFLVTRTRNQLDDGLEEEGCEAVLDEKSMY